METIYNAPSKFKIEPYGTLLRQLLDSIGNEERFLLWIQSSKDPNAMNWMTTEKFFAAAFDIKLLDVQFKQMALEAFEKSKPTV